MVLRLASLCSENIYLHHRTWRFAPNTSSLVLKASLGSKEDFGLFPYWLLATTVLFKGGDVRLYTPLPPTGSLQLSLTCSTGGELEKKKTVV